MLGLFLSRELPTVISPLLVIFTGELPYTCIPIDLSPNNFIVLFEVTDSFVYIPFPVAPFTVSIIPPLVALITVPSA